MYSRDRKSKVARLPGQIVFLLICSTLIHCSSEPSYTAPQANDGVMDLRGWNPLTDESVSLTGQWRFAWQQALTPGPIEALSTLYPNTIKAPLSWLGQSYNGVPEGTLPSTGYGTYLLRIRLPNELSEPLSIMFPAVRDTANIAVTDIHGQALAPAVEQGRFGLDAANNIPNRATHFLSLLPPTHPEVVIWITVGNFHQHRGGLTKVPTLGFHNKLASEHKQAEWLAAFLLGVLLIIALYHAVLFFQRTQDPVALLFALFCGSVALRQSLMMRLFDHLQQDWSLAAWAWTLRLEYLSIPLMGATAGFFVFSLLDSAWFKKFLVGWSFLGVVLILFSLLGSTIQITTSVWMYQTHILLGLVMVLTHVTISTLQEKPLAGWLLLGFIILGVGAINDILYDHRIIQTAHITPYCFAGFILLQSGTIASNFSRAFIDRDNLNQRVIYQTAQIAHESESRTIAEHTLRLEAESKVLLFSDAVHHLNNPINHIVGAMHAISSEQSSVRDTIDMLLQGEADNPEAQEVSEFFQKRFGEISRHINATHDATGRAGETIELLRVLSGIDGTSFQQTTVSEILDLSQKRNGSFMENIDIKDVLEHSTTRCVGHPSLYAQALELILSAISSDIDNVDRIRFIESNNQSHHRLVLDFQAEQRGEDMEELFSLIGHLLKPYQCQARYTSGTIELEILSDCSILTT